jgi:ATP-binding cassette, subfamily A (ABC1), member 3
MTIAYLPAWIIVAIVWHFCIFTRTSILLVLVTHILLGLSLASWSFFVATFFGNSPQLAAIATTLLAMSFAIIACVYSSAGTLVATIFSVFSPPGYYIFAIRAICGFEINLMVTDALKPDPDNGLMLFPLLIVAGVCVTVMTVYPGRL